MARDRTSPQGFLNSPFFLFTSPVALGGTTTAPGGVAGTALSDLRSICRLSRRVIPGKTVWIRRVKTGSAKFGQVFLGKSNGWIAGGATS